MPSVLDLRRLASAVRRRLAPATAVPQPSVPAQPLADFVCNICGHPNTSTPREQMQNREGQSCRSCASSLRMRSVMYALSMELFAKALVVRDFPADKSIAGIGMSDWEGYAAPLREKFDYTNSYYQAEPRLDITRIPDEAVEGMTLEMRMFTEPDLLRRLREAGFSSVKARIDYAPAYGIHWPIDYAVPIVARRGGAGGHA